MHFFLGNNFSGIIFFIIFLKKTPDQTVMFIFQNTFFM